MARRKRYSPEFKRQALRRANEPGVTDALVCEELGVSTRQLRRWREAIQDTVKRMPFRVTARARDQELDTTEAQAEEGHRGTGFFKRSGTVLCQGVEVRYACIHRRRHQHSIRKMCRFLRVSRSGYYDWSQRAESARSLRDRELRLLIRQIHLESGGVYGARKVHHELLRLGEDCGRHRVARLMREDGLKGCPKRRFRRPSNVAPGTSLCSEPA